MNIEFCLNASATICFVWLFYRLAVLAGSSFIRFRELKNNTTALRAFNAACQQQLEQGESGISLSKAAQTVLFGIPSAEFVVTKLKQVILMLDANDHVNADHELDSLVDRQAMQYAKHFQLADLANSIGMAYTVAGGIQVFSCIGSSDDPFAAFPGLALAMVTTLAGLAISIPTKEILANYAARVNSFETLATELSFSLARGIQLTNNYQQRRRVIAAPQPKTIEARDDELLSLPDGTNCKGDSRLDLTKVERATKVLSQRNGKPKLTVPGDDQ